MSFTREGELPPEETSPDVIFRRRLDQLVAGYENPYPTLQAKLRVSLHARNCALEALLKLDAIESYHGLAEDREKYLAELERSLAAVPTAAIPSGNLPENRLPDGLLRPSPQQREQYPDLYRLAERSTQQERRWVMQMAVEHRRRSALLEEGAILRFLNYLAGIQLAKP